MKLGTRVGWILIAISVIFSVWVISGDKNEANQTTDDGFVLNDAGTEVISYNGNGGQVRVPDGVTTIDSGVFANQTGITSVSMPDTVTNIGTGLFSGCTGLSGVSLSGNLTSIPANTFYNCSSLSNVAIPSSVSTIGASAFYGCSGISSVSIPSRVSSIDSSAFDNCKNLASIQVAGGNSTYSSSDGCLYNANGTNLIRCPENKATITLSSNCTSIGSGALKDCTSIDSITIGKNVTNIAGDAFSGSGLRTIYGYSGSKAEDYADSYGYSFIQLDNTGSGSSSSSSSSTDEDEDGDDGSETVEDEDDDDGDSDSGDSDRSGDDSSSDDGSGGSGGPGGSGGSGGGSTSGGPSGSGGHNKDATPKTADGDVDPRFMFSLALLLMGGAFIVGSRRKKIDYIQTHRK